jgi:hypothetical protein
MSRLLMLTRSQARRDAAKEGKLPGLPPEIIDEILLCIGDVKLVNALGGFG